MCFGLILMRPSISGNPEALQNRIVKCEIHSQDALLEVGFPMEYIMIHSSKPETM